MPQKGTAFRPGMKALLELLRGSASILKTDVETDVDWGEVLDMAEEQRVLPMAAAELRRQHPALPGRLDERITGIEREGLRAAFWWRAELKGVLEAFNSNGIDTILLKGPFFAQRIYGNACLRSSSDVDLLVRRTQIFGARRLLAAIGFGLIQKDNGYHESWSRGETALELHYDVAPQALFEFNVDTAWTRAHAGSFAGQPTQCFDLPDELLFLCVHGARHCFEHLGHILDIAMLLEHRAREDSDGGVKLVERTDTRPLAGVLLLGCELARRLRPVKPFVFDMPIAARSRMRLQAMAEVHWEQMVTKPQMGRNWMSVRRFYRQTEVTRRNHARSVLRDVCDGALLLIEADYEFAKRFGASEERRWMIRIFRYVRLALAQVGMGGRV